MKVCNKDKNMLTKEENETLKLKVGPETKTHNVIYRKKNWYG